MTGRSALSEFDGQTDSRAPERSSIRSSVQRLEIQPMQPFTNDVITRPKPNRIAFTGCGERSTIVVVHAIDLPLDINFPILVGRVVRHT